MTSHKTAIIIGAGPAGLTAAYELLKETEIKPIILESSGDIGGLSKTVNHNDNRIDLGGHRFFSKSRRIVEFWLNILPLQSAPAKDYRFLGIDVPLSGTSQEADPEKTDAVMLNRKRLSRIFYERKFFDYPLSLNMSTVSQLGVVRTLKIGFSYLKSCVVPIRPEMTLEVFLVNRFGRELYHTFFKDYTEKIWGQPCSRIPADWGRQRIKNLSIKKALVHAVKNLFCRDNSIAQRQVETSLISNFLYPKFGPGQLWETLAKIIESKGGTICRHQKVVQFIRRDNRIVEVVAEDQQSRQRFVYRGDYVFSSMPVNELAGGFGGDLPASLKEIADGLEFRDFITVGLLLKKMNLKNKTQIPTPNDRIPDNWIYVQEKDVQVARVQIFNNWSPYMVADDNLVWIGLEYICSASGTLWSNSDECIKRIAIEELEKIGFAERTDVVDSVVIRMPKAYPAYFGTYSQFGRLRDYFDVIENLFLIGRNGMHRYNNMDHSMLSAMTAVENIKNGTQSKDNIWQVNAEEDYHEDCSKSRVDARL